MAKEKSQRYASANEVADLLRQCLAQVQQPMVQSIPRSLQDSAPKLRRRFVIAALASVLMSVGAFLWTRPLADSPRRNEPPPMAVRGKLPTVNPLAEVAPRENPVLESATPVGSDDDPSPLAPAALAALAGDLAAQLSEVSHEVDVLLQQMEAELSAVDLESLPEQTTPPDPTDVPLL